MAEEIVPVEEPQKEEISTSVEEKREKRWLKPLLFSVLGIIVAVGLVFAGYKLAQLRQVQPGPQPTPTPVAEATPTPDPTTDWITYMDTEYGYSIKYPKDWIQGGEPRSVFFQNPELPKTDDEKIPEDRIFIRIFTEETYEKDLSTEEYLERIFEFGGVPKGTKLLEKQYANVVDREALVATLDPRETPSESYSMIKLAIVKVDSNKFVKILLLPYLQKSYEKGVPIFNLMLSTFRFLE